MNFYTAGFFITLLFCMFSGIGEELSEGFTQNPEYIIPSQTPEKPAEEKHPVQTGETTTARPAQTVDTNYNPHRGTAYLRRNNPSDENDNMPKAPWANQELKNWENRQNPVPSVLPRVTDFRPKTSNNVGNLNRSRSYYGSANSRNRKISEKDGRIRIRVKNHR